MNNIMEKHKWVNKRVFESVLFLVMFAVLFYLERVRLMPSSPTGADPGNWLAGAWELSGENIRLVDWIYPPLSLVLLRILLFIVPPMNAVKAIGFLSSFLGGVLFYFGARITYGKQSPLFHFGITILIFMSGYFGEMLAWGGYPQLLATAFLVAHFTSLELWLQDDSATVHFFMAAINFALVCYASHFVASVMMICLILIMLLSFLRSGKDWRIMARKWLKFLFITFLLVSPVLVTYWKFYIFTEKLPTNPQDFSIAFLRGLFAYCFQGLHWLWILLLVIGVWVAFKNLADYFAYTTVALILSPLLLLMVSWEMRLMQFVILGVGYGLLLIGSKLSTSQISPNLKISLTALFVAFAIVSMQFSNLWFIEKISHYQVVSDDALAALQWLTMNTEPQDVVAVSPWKPFSLGWWVEGYSKRPCIYAMDVRYLTFSGERMKADIANKLFKKNSSPGEIARLIQENGIKYILIDKTEKLSIPDHFVEKFQVLYENPRVLILKTGIE